MKKKVMSLPKESERKTIEEGFREFIQSCKIKKLSHCTVISYELHFKRFERFIYKGKITMLDEITKDLINTYILHLKEEGGADMHILTI